MSSNNKGIRITVSLCIAVAALVSGLFVFQHVHFKKPVDEASFHGAFLKQPRQVSMFRLEGVDSKPYDNESLKGHWTMMFFGFTNCGHVCPMAMGELARMYRSLEEKQIKPLPQVVMISIDPDRDSMEKLGHYVKAFDKHFYGARGDNEAIKAMGRELGIAYSKVALKDSPNAEDYDIQHSGAVMVFNPDGKLQAFFTGPHKAKNLVEDYQQLVR